MKTILNLKSILSDLKSLSKPMMKGILGALKENGIQVEDAKFIKSDYIVKSAEVKKSERAIVIRVSTGIVDLEGEVLLQDGCIQDCYNNSVLWCHKFDELPIGKSIWTKMANGDLISKMVFAKHKKANDLYDLYCEDVLGTGPICDSWSVGFIPLSSVTKRSAGWEEAFALAKRARPEIESQLDQINKIITKWLLIEYSAIPIGANPEARTIMISKGISQEVIDTKILPATEDISTDTIQDDNKDNTSEESMPLQEDTNDGGTEDVEQGIVDMLSGETQAEVIENDEEEDKPGKDSDGITPPVEKTEDGDLSGEDEKQNQGGEEDEGEGSEDIPKEEKDEDGEAEGKEEGDGKEEEKAVGDSDKNKEGDESETNSEKDGRNSGSEGIEGRDVIELSGKKYFLTPVDQIDYNKNETEIDEIVIEGEQDIPNPTETIKTSLFLSRQKSLEGQVKTKGWDEAMEYMGWTLILKEVSPESAIRMVDNLLLMNQFDSNHEITIIVDSPGGSVSEGFAIIDAMNYISNPVRTIGIGIVASMGLQIFMAGDNRLLSPSTLVLSHRFWTMFAGTQAELDATAVLWKTIGAQIIKHYKIHSNLKSKEAIESTLLKTTDVWLTPKQTIEFGLADGIFDKSVQLTSSQNEEGEKVEGKTIDGKSDIDRIEGQLASLVDMVKQSNVRTEAALKAIQDKGTQSIEAEGIAFEDSDADDNSQNTITIDENSLVELLTKKIKTKDQLQEDIENAIRIAQGKVE